MNMRDAWAKQASGWIRLVRGGLDAGWDSTRPPFLRLVPPPGRLTVDVGCGEGRMGRELTAAGHRIIGVDATFALAQAAASHPQPLDLIVGDAARLPLRDSAADLVVAFMSLMDIDDFSEAIREASRVLEDGGAVLLRDRASTS